MRRLAWALAAAALAATASCGEKNVADDEFPPGYWVRDAEVPADAGRPDAAIPRVWREVAAPFDGPYALNAIGGFAGTPRAALAVGEAGLVLRLEGGSWSKVPHSLTAASLRAVAFAGAAEAWIAGAAGTVLRWTPVAGLEDRSLAGAPELSAVLASGDAVWVAGRGGALWRQQGGVWTDHSLPSGPDLVGMWGDGTVAWAAGADGQVLRLEGAEWRKVAQLGALHAISGVGPELLWLAGDGVVTELDDREGTARLTAHPTPGQAAALSYRALWAGAADDVWVGAHRRALLRWTGSVWDPVPDFEATAVSPALRGLWGAAPDDVWAVGVDTLLHLAP